MSFLRSRRGILVLGILIVLGLYVVRPGAGRLRARIVHSISLALGRQVDVASVTLRFLPQPGFELENFVVHDDPAFSAEPMLRSDLVTASLRISSLFRGRLEISRLTLTEPSLNLVRNSDGHWNLESLLERAANTPIAPTSKARTEIRPGFPYIEADRGRINFKFGQEKKPYALTDADFGLWQDSENAWGMRLKAQPVRTDFNLSDTGLLAVNGTWQRAQALRTTPLHFNLLWERAQLGQASKLVYGNDKGWRGTIEFSATLSGTPADLSITSSASIQDFRRYDILSGGASQLAAQCTGHYSTAERTLSNLACHAPVDDGTITVNGSISTFPGSPTYDLDVIAEHVPMQALVGLARRAKKNIPDDLIATGKLEANAKYRGSAIAEQNSAAWEGSGETTGFRLRSNTTKTELALDKIPFVISSGTKSGARLKNDGFRDSPESAQSASETHLDIGPFNLVLGRPSPMVAHGRISSSGYNLTFQGDAQVQRLLQIARAMGVPALQFTGDGAAKIDLQVAGNWTGFKPPQTMGKVQLHAIRAPVNGFNAPVEIASADLILQEDEIVVQNVTASLGKSTWRGSLIIPRRCATPGHCPLHFDLRSHEVATDQLGQLLRSQPSALRWYQFSSLSSPGVPFLRSLHAAGKLTVDRLLVHKLVATGVSANTELEDGKLRLSDLRGNVLGGRHAGEWKADFTVKPPKYTASGTLDRAALGQLADAMHDGWVTGTATTKYQASASGWSAANLLSSANAEFQVQAEDARLPHITLANTSEPLEVRRFAGRFLLHDGNWDIKNGKLETTSGIYQLDGTASLNRDLDLKLARDGGRGFSITGTLTEPIVSATTPAETRAELKP